jgi:predicted alpha/beta-hydrolase family hydrolase
VDDLTVHWSGGVKDAPEHTHALEDLERAGLHANRFGVERRLEQGVDDSAPDAASGQLDRGGQADRARSCDEHVDVGGFGKT